MKNFFLFSAIVTLFFTSCTNDSLNSSDSSSDSMMNNEVTNFSAKSLKDITALYKGMINSSEYIDFSNATKIFVDNLNSKNLNFTDEKDLKAWAMSNISSTKFADYASFNTAWDNLKAKQIIVFQSHQLFFNELNANYPNIYIDYSFEPAGTGPCEDALLICEENAATNRTITCAFIMAYAPSSSWSENFTVAETNYQSAIDGCYETYNGCI